MADPAYLTVSEAADMLGMTPGGVRAAITGKRLRAIKRSERKTLVPRFAIEAYQARLNGEGPSHPSRPALVGLDHRVEEFVALTGLDPADWLRRWRADADLDTADVMRVAISALAIEVERRDDAESSPEVRESLTTSSAAGPGRR